MALIKCPECNAEISDQAIACPNCGCPIKKESTEKVVKTKKLKKIPAFVWAIPLVLVVVILMICILNRSKVDTIDGIAIIAEKAGYSYTIEKPANDEITISLNDGSLTVKELTEDSTSYEKALSNLRNSSELTIVSTDEKNGYKYIYVRMNRMNSCAMYYWNDDFSVMVWQSKKSFDGEVKEVFGLLHITYPDID